MREKFIFVTALPLLLLGGTPTSSARPSRLTRYETEEKDDGVCTRPHEWTDHPALCHTLQRLKDPNAANRATVIQELYQSALDSGWIVDFREAEKEVDDNSNNNSSTTSDSIVSADSTLRRRRRRHRRRTLSTAAATTASALPVVLAHGMGDSCFNSGMQHITRTIAQWLGVAGGDNNDKDDKDDNGVGVYTVCIPTGPTQAEDTKNGYFLNMDGSVDVFARAVQRDPQLRHGFHALGFSQGNNIIRGYIAKYNAPAVHTFLSVNGVNAGVGAVPHCRPTNSNNNKAEDHPHPWSVSSLPLLFPSVCDLLMEQASRSAYTAFAQEHSFQANYWRDPRPSAADRYHQYSQLAVWNNEVPGSINETLRSNWAKTQSFVWVRAMHDTMVWPSEGEQWGAPDANAPFSNRVLPMNETDWYQRDLFGLRTADQAGKNHWESFAGDHLQFTIADLKRWVTTYFSVPKPTTTTAVTTALTATASTTTTSAQ